MKLINKNCENCKHYFWEDSVWGHCRRFPPKEELVKIFPKLKYKMSYPEVIAGEDSCGEFEINYKLWKK